MFVVQFRFNLRTFWVLIFCYLTKIRESWVSRRKSSGYLVQQQLFEPFTINIHYPGYLKLYQARMRYLGYLLLSVAFSCYIKLPLSNIKYQGAIQEKVINVWKFLFSLFYISILLTLYKIKIVIVVLKRYISMEDSWLCCTTHVCST